MVTHQCTSCIELQVNLIEVQLLSNAEGSIVSNCQYSVPYVKTGHIIGVVGREDEGCLLLCDIEEDLLISCGQQVANVDCWVGDEASLIHRVR